MRGMKSLVAPTKRQNFADGGVVGAIKGMFGIKPEDPERARRLAEYQANAAREKEAAKAATAPTQAPAPAITDYAAGSALKRREAAAGLKDGGPVRGPGTGTSDDVPDNVPEGTYIMPADSTKAIGEKTLGGLGMRGIDVNLSNGEFKLSPKQVHAIGVQTLNQMKDATHTPSSTEAAKGMKSELFFEGGGVASEEERQRRISQIPVGGNMPAPPADGKNDTEFSRNVNNGLNALGGMGVVASTPLRAPAVAQELRGAYQTLTGPAAKAAAPAADFIAGAGPNATAYANTIPRLGNAPTPALPAVNAALQEGAQANALAATARTAAGAGAQATSMDNRNGADAPAVPGQPSEYGRQMSAVGGALVDGAVWLGKTAVSAPGYGLSAADRTAPSAVPAGTGAGRGVVNPATVTPASPAAGQPPAQGGALPDPQAGSATNQIAPGVYQHGRGQYSDQAGGMGMPANFTGQPSAENMARMDAIANRSQQESMNRVQARGMGAVGGPGSGPVEPGSFTGGFSGVIGSANLMGSRTPEQQRRDAEVSASSIHKPTAARGMAALAALDGRALEQERGQNSLAQENTRQAGALEREGIQQAGANQRAGMTAGTEQQRLGIEASRAAGEAESRGFQTRAAGRQEKLYERYQAAKTDTERSAIAKQIRDLSVKEQPARYKVAAGGQQIDANGVAYRVPDRVFNEQTGVFSDGAGAAPAPQIAPTPGEVRNGYRFKGGNPNDQANWTKV